MLPRFCQVIALLSCLLIGLELCQSASLERVRSKRDTRNISSDLFKPVDSSTNTDQSVPQKKKFLDTFSEQSSTKAQTLTEPSSNEENNEESSWQRYPNPGLPPRIPYNFGGNRQSNFESSFDSNFRPFGYVPGHIGPVGPSSRNSNFIVSRYNSMPLSIQTGPFLSTPNGFSQSSNPFDDGSSNNYYRSESYSFKSDGSGPPQIQQSVFDSRLGPGIISSNF